MTRDRGQRLDSWKSIATYLDRDVRTVMRWERDAGMPVHRVPGKRRGRSVFAFTGELDAWLADGASAGEAGIPVRSGTALPGAAPRGPQSLAMAAIAGAAILAMATWSLSWIPSQSPPPGGSGRDEATAAGTDRLPLSRIEANATAIVARDVDGQIAFAVEHPEGWTFQGLSNGRILDLGRGGPKELLTMTDAVDPARPSHVRGELYAFAEHGDVLWRQVLDEDVEFGAGVFGAPWLATSFETVVLDGALKIAWATQHYRWWPSILVLLEADGKVVSRFVHSGWITQINALATAGGDRLLLGGISNSRGAAMLAVLDGAAADGGSPEEPGSPYECLSCPAGRPLLYFVFPPSEMTRASGAPYNEVVGIEVTDRHVNVTTREGDKRSAVTWTYELSHDFELLRIIPSDTYWPRRQAMQRDGKLPEASGRHAPADPILRWTPAAGWEAIAPPEPLTEFGAESVADLHNHR